MFCKKELVVLGERFFGLPWAQTHFGTLHLAVEEQVERQGLLLGGMLNGRGWHHLVGHCNTRQAT